MFTGWILNIVGMVFMGVILEVILPSGKTNLFIKSMFAMFVLYVIVNPLPKIFNSDINLKNESTISDTNFLISLNLEKVSALENDIKNLLNQNGYENVSVVISANIYTENSTINKIYLDLSNMVLKNLDKHININEHIKTITTSKVNIAWEDIIIYE